MSTSTQVKLIKLKFGCNKFGKTAMPDSETKIFLEKSHLTKLMKSMTNLSKRIPNVTFNFILRIINKHMFIPQVSYAFLRK